MIRVIKYLIVVATLLLAAYFRWTNLSREAFAGDGVQIFIKSLGVTHGRFTFIGPPMSAGTSHSPFSVYMYALPALLSPDYRVAIMFTGAMHLIAAALIFKIGSRYFSFAAGFIGVLLFAVHPEALFISRQVLNTVLSLPLALAYLFTGVLGYYENKKFARWIHLPFLTLAAQCHPGAFFLAPVMLILFGYSLWHFPRQRKQIFLETLASGGVAVMLLTPWAIGIAQQLSERASAASAFDLSQTPGWDYILENVIGQITSWESGFAKSVLLPLALTGLVWLMWRALWRRESFVGFVVASSFITLPIMFWFANVKFRGTYFYPGYAFLFLILGVVLGGVRLRKPEGSYPRFDWRGLLPTPYIGWVTWIIVALIVYTHINFFSRSGAQPPTIGDYTNSVNTAHQLAQKTNRELLMLIPYGAQAQYDYFPWEVLNEGRANSRVIWHGRALPLPVNGAVLIGPASTARC
ncbi:MAG: glycosyltransferase family 39 protein [Chloroflexi bacterium]|nr:glycosyltransferase family 39 protein [Chloroflexota bacterium]